MDKDLLGVAERIKTPLSFLSLVILISEGLLFLLIDKAHGVDFTILVLGMALLPFACLLALYFLFKKDVKQSMSPPLEEGIEQPTGTTYDLFVSTPMAAFETEEEFRTSREAIQDVVRGIKKTCKFTTVFYEGGEIESTSDFESEDLSVVKDYDALSLSQYFILIYPKQLASSCLIELGWAMAFNKPIIIFIKTKEDLPFLMKHADAVFKNIKIYEYKTSSDIQNRFAKNGVELFK